MMDPTSLLVHWPGHPPGELSFLSAGGAGHSCGGLFPGRDCVDLESDSTAERSKTGGRVAPGSSIPTIPSSPVKPPGPDDPGGPDDPDSPDDPGGSNPGCHQLLFPSLIVFSSAVFFSASSFPSFVTL